MKNILLISNGHAEDLAAAEIGKKLKFLSPDAKLRAFPLVGLGKAYEKQDIENYGLRTMLPSGGFAKEGLAYFINDLLAGWFGLLAQQIKAMKTLGKQADLVVAVGDAYLVALCGLFIKKPLIFIDGPKSIKIASYFPLELWLMKKFCKKIIVQDQETADFLQKKGLPAHYLGSWVMDYVPTTGFEFGIAKERTVIGMLPGTRNEAYDNLLLVLDVFKKMGKQAPEKLLGLIASTLDIKLIRKKINATNWELLELGEGNIRAKLISKEGLEALLVERLFGDVCINSNLIIGMAGIANEQAVAFGRPTVCFVGSGPQTTLRRWNEIQKITGKSMAIIAGSAEQKASAIWHILRDSDRMKEMAKIGRESKPMRGATAKIAMLIKESW